MLPSSSGQAEALLSCPGDRKADPPGHSPTHFTQLLLGEGILRDAFNLFGAIVFNQAAIRIGNPA
jgi:hypothetical protein